jgi:hypothetical protein
MACSCQNKSNKSTASTFVVTSSSGQQSTYKTEIEAVAAAKRTGGTWRKQS